MDDSEGSVGLLHRRKASLCCRDSGLAWALFKSLEKALKSALGTLDHHLDRAILQVLHRSNQPVRLCMPFHRPAETHPLDLAVNVKSELLH